MPLHLIRLEGQASIPLAHREVENHSILPSHHSKDLMSLENTVILGVISAQFVGIQLTIIHQFTARFPTLMMY